MKDRLLYIDILRVFACFLVILTHSAMSTDNPAYSMSLGLLAFAGSASSELFISLSGGVLLPVKTGTRQFYKRRFLKLMPPLFFWSVVIILFNAIKMPGDIDWGLVVQRILFLPFREATGVYWFVYVMIGLYLFAPFISKWLESASKRQVQLFFALWTVNLLLPYANLLLGDKGISYNTHYWELNYFGGFLGYWLIGYYLRRYPMKIGANLPFIGVCIGVVAYTCIMAFYRQIFGISPARMLDDNLQAGSAFMVVFFYTLAQNIKINNDTVKRCISDVAKMSFGIYLIHILVVRECVWHLFDGYVMHPIPQTLVISVMSMAICYVIVKAISYLPGSKYIIGV